jgi:hypothetical protein
MATWQPSTSASFSTPRYHNPEVIVRFFFLARSLTLRRRTGIQHDYRRIAGGGNNTISSV